MLIKIIEKRIKEKPDGSGASYFNVDFLIKSRETMYKSRFVYYVTNENWSYISKLKNEINILSGYIDYSNPHHKKALKDILSIEAYNKLIVYSDDRHSDLKEEIEVRKELLNERLQIMASKEENEFSITLNDGKLIDEINKVEYFREEEKISYVKKIKRCNETSDSFLRAIESFIEDETKNKVLKIIKERTNDRSFISF